MFYFVIYFFVLGLVISITLYHVFLATLRIILRDDELFVASRFEELSPMQSLFEVIRVVKFLYRRKRKRNISKV